MCCNSVMCYTFTIVAMLAFLLSSSLSCGTVHDLSVLEDRVPRGGAIEWSSLPRNYSTPRYESDPFHRKRPILASISKSRRFSRPHRSLLSDKVAAPAGPPENHSELELPTAPSAEEISSPKQIIEEEAVKGEIATVTALTEGVDALEVRAAPQVAMRPDFAQAGSQKIEKSVFNSAHRLSFLKDLLLSQKQSAKHKPDASALLRTATKLKPATPKPLTVDDAPTVPTTAMDDPGANVPRESPVLNAEQSTQQKPRTGSDAPIPGGKTLRAVKERKRAAPKTPASTSTPSVPVTVKNDPFVYVHSVSPDSITVTHYFEPQPEPQPAPNSFRNWWYDPGPADESSRATRATTIENATAHAQTDSSLQDQLEHALSKFFGHKNNTTVTALVPDHTPHSTAAQAESASVEAQSVVNTTSAGSATAEMQALKQQEEALRTALQSREETIRELADRLAQLECMYQGNMRLQRAVSNDIQNQEVSVAPSAAESAVVADAPVASAAGAAAAAPDVQAEQSPVEHVQVQVQLVPSVTLWNMEANSVNVNENVDIIAGESELGSQASLQDHNKPADVQLTNEVTTVDAGDALKAPPAIVEGNKNAVESPPCLSDAEVTSDHIVIQELERAIREYQRGELELVKQCSALSAQLCLLRGQKYSCHEHVDRNAIAKGGSSGGESVGWYNTCVRFLFGAKL